MTWFRLDDTWLTHPKVQAAGLKGRALWIAGGLHCAQHLTDGRIPKTALPMLAVAAQVGTGRKEAAQLVDVGLWAEDGDCFVMNDYLTYQPSRAKVEEERAKAAERQRKLREKSRRDTAVSHASPDPTRTHPDPNGYSSTTTNDRGLSASATVVEITRTIARARLERQRDTEIIEDESAYLAGIQRNVKSELGDRIVSTVNDNPSLPIDDLVRLVLGDYEGAA